ncbi:MAG: choice-of-anchor D domain-containing protein [Verrucomicrobiales bacterium]
MELEFGGDQFPFVADYFGGTGNDLVLVWKARRVYGWGANPTGSLGIGAEGDRHVLTELVREGALEGKTILRVAAGGAHALAVTSDGMVYSWGNNSNGQLGHPDRRSISVPVPVDMNGNPELAGKKFVAVAAGNDHSLALSSDGTVAAWGTNWHGQLGDGSTVSRHEPRAISTAIGESAVAGRKVVAIAAGGVSSLAICSDGTVVQWGGYEYDDGFPWPTMQAQTFPEAVDASPGNSALRGRLPLLPVVDATRSVLCSDGSIVGWGLNYYGALGDGTLESHDHRPVTANASDPQSALTGRLVTLMTAGSALRMALCSDGSVVGWGSNGPVGVLGSPAPWQIFPWPTLLHPVATPSALTGRTVVDLATSRYGAAALCADGALVQWGWPGNASVEPTIIGFLPQRPGERLVKVVSGPDSSNGFAIAAARPEPAIQITGNGLPLSNGDAAPEAEIRTDFGSQPIGGVAMRHVFMIHNLGDAELELTGNPLIRFDGAQAGDFTVTRPPSSIVPAHGGATSFEIAFAPSGPWLRSAEVVVGSTDPHDAEFRFTVHGTGRAALSAHFSVPSDIPLTVSEGMDTAQSTVELSLGFHPVAGTELMVVKNTGLVPLSHAFVALEHGQPVTLQHEGFAYDFVANYFGGSGNDLTLVWRKNHVMRWGRDHAGQSPPNPEPHLHPVTLPAGTALADATIVSVAAGPGYGIALLSNGTLAAWGDNSAGTLGDGTTQSRYSPVMVDTSPGSALHGKRVVSVVAASQRPVALCSDGSLAIWGYLGSTVSTVPVPLKFDTRFPELRGRRVVALAGHAGIEAGQYYLALCSDGSLLTWSEAQLGLEPVVARVLTNGNPSSALFKRRVVAIAAGTTMLALRSDGELVEWSGAAAPDPEFNNLPRLVSREQGVSSLYGRTVVEMACGFRRAFVLTSDGAISGWGNNIAFSGPDPIYLLGDGSTMAERLHPALVSQSPAVSALAGRSARQVAAHGQHALAVCDDGQAVSWGISEGPGVLGDGTSNHTSYPVLLSRSNLAPGDRFVRLSTHLDHSLGVVASDLKPRLCVSAGGVPVEAGNLKPRRDNRTDFGVVSDESATLTQVFDLVNDGDRAITLTGVPSVTITGTHAADFTVTQVPATRLERFGGEGQLGISFRPSGAGLRRAVVRLTSTDAAHPVYEWAIQATAPQHVQAALTAAGEPPLTTSAFDATGSTIAFELHYVPLTGQPILVVENTGMDITYGSFDGLPQGATVQLQYGGQTYYMVADYFGGDGNDLVLHWENSFPVHWKWDRTSIPQGSDPIVQGRFRPKSIAPPAALAGKTVVRLAATGHTVALCADGTLVAWGDNHDGQLGDGTFTNRDSPITVNSTHPDSALLGKSVIAIAVGYSHTLALCSDGSVAAWGSNQDGQLGNGSTAPSAIPVLVDATPGESALAGRRVVRIDASGSRSMALCADGTVVMWGKHYGTSAFDLKTIFVRPTVVGAGIGVSELAEATVIAIAAGDVHALALREDGSLVAWGENRVGQLGVDPNGLYHGTAVVNSAASVSALHGRRPVTISAGRTYSLALCDDGAVVAWGGNDHGVLGDGTTLQRWAPGLVDATPGSSALAGKSVVDVKADSSVSLALCSDGSLVGWGNAGGSLAEGGFPAYFAYNGDQYASRPVAVAPPPGERLSVFAAICQGKACPRFFALASGPFAARMRVFGNGAAIDHPNRTPSLDRGTNFGASEVGQAVVRRFTVMNEGNADLVMTGFPIIGLAGLGAGEFRVVSLPATTVPRFGGSTDFELGFVPGSAWARRATVTIASNDPVRPSYEFEVMGTGKGHLAAELKSPADVPLVTSAGLDARGSSLSLSLQFEPILGAELPIMRMEGGGWIEGDFDGLAHGQPIALRHAEVTYPFVANFFGGDGNDLSLTWLKQRGFGWGDNTDGQLGIGSASTSMVVPNPAPLSLLRTGDIGEGILMRKTIVTVSAGAAHGLALTADGILSAWGSNEYGQLGNPAYSARRWPGSVDVTAETSALRGKRVAAIAAGGSHSLALCGDGTIAAWGQNSSGQLGTGTITGANLPIDVLRTEGSALFGKQAAAIAAGANHSLALCTDGTVVAWGAGGLNLGIGDGNSSARPLRVSTSVGVSALAGRTVVSIAAGTQHSLALCGDGRVVAWGSNDRGQLGDGTVQPRLVPTAVDSISPNSALRGRTVQSVAAGAYHTLALCSDGTLVAWGMNSEGQLGDGTTEHRSIPVLVNADAGISALAGRLVTRIAAGSAHSLAVCSDGTAAVWGANARGQLGTGTTTRALVPTTAAFANLKEGEQIVNVFSGSRATYSFAIAAAPALAHLDHWRHQWFGTYDAVNDAADDADTDSDGAPNLVEWAAGSSPLSAGALPIQVVPIPNTNSAVFVEYTVSDAAIRAGALVTIESSRDLKTWSLSPYSSSFQLVSTENGLRRYRYRLVRSSTSLPWVRLKVTSPF